MAHSREGVVTALQEGCLHSFLFHRASYLGMIKRERYLIMVRKTRALTQSYFQCLPWMQLHKKHEALFLALQDKTRLSNLLAHVGLPQHSLASSFSFAKFERRFRSEILVQMPCEKGSQVLNMRVVQPAMEVLATQLLILSFPYALSFSQILKRQISLFDVLYKYRSGCGLGAH